MQSKSQIVATIGPASSNIDTLINMISAGIDVARLNFSWGTHEEHANNINIVRQASGSVGKNIIILQDLSGPRMKTEGGHSIDTEKAKTGVITEKDLADLKFGIEQNVDYVALSYVGSASDILELKNKIAEFGGKQKVIAKIERQEAINNFDEILKVTDAVMIARGDLGDVVPLPSIPFIQRELILKCSVAGKPVITATQMMLSMVESDKPTRAEVTDVAFAIMCGSDAVMLSEETARGKYPVEAVKMMESIVSESERRLPLPHPINLL